MIYNEYICKYNTIINHSNTISNYCLVEQDNITYKYSLIFDYNNVRKFMLTNNLIKPIQYSLLIYINEIDSYLQAVIFNSYKYIGLIKFFNNYWIYIPFLDVNISFNKLCAQLRKKFLYFQAITYDCFLNIQEIIKLIYNKLQINKDKINSFYLLHNM